MLKKIIKELLEEAEESFENIDDKVEEVVEEMKGIAKQIFFDGEMKDLKDFIYDESNERNDAVKKRLSDGLHGIVGDGEAFIQNLRAKINAKMEELKMEKNIESLLDLLDYGHLKGMLKMFKF